MRSYFILSPGLPRPDQFKSNVAPPLIAIQDLWDAAKQAPNSLIFRVRSESAADAPLSLSDTLESCVGIVDSATRWRTSFKMAFTLVPAIQHKPLLQACTAALQFVSTAHPAGVSVAQRLAILENITAIAMKEGDDAPHPFEVRIADGVATLAMCEGDYEAAASVPFLGALVPFHKDKNRKEYDARMGTVETMSGTFLLSEAAARLAERMPSWIFSKMPALTLPGTEENEAPRPMELDEEDEED